MIDLTSVTVSPCVAEAEPGALGYNQVCSAWNTSPSKSSCLILMLSYLVGLFLVAQGSFSFWYEFVLGGCVWGGGKRSVLHPFPTPFIIQLTYVNAISVFPSAKPLVFYKLNTSWLLGNMLLGLTLNVRQGWGFLIIGDVLINLISIKELGNSKERFMWFYM